MIAGHFLSVSLHAPFILSEGFPFVFTGHDLPVRSVFSFKIFVDEAGADRKAVGLVPACTADTDGESAPGGGICAEGGGFDVIKDIPVR